MHSSEGLGIEVKDRVMTLCKATLIQVCLATCNSAKENFSAKAERTL